MPLATVWDGDTVYVPVPPVPVPAALMRVFAANPTAASVMPVWMTPLLTAVTVSVVPEMLAVKRALANPMLGGTSGGLAPVAALRSACCAAELVAAVRFGPT